MKILIVHPQMGQYGGAELVVVRMSQLLQKWGHSVDILTLSSTDHPDYEGLNFILPRHQIEYQLRTGIRFFPSIGRIYLTLRGMYNGRLHEYDVVNIHNFPAIWTAPTSHKVVWMCNEIPDLWHNSKTPLVTRIGFGAGKIVDKHLVRSRRPLIVVADERCAERVSDRYGMKSIINPYGIDAFEPSTNRSDSFTVIHPAMVSPSKNQMEVLQALVSLKGRIQHPKLIVSGYYEPRHPYTLSLHEYIKRYHLDVEFVGLGTRSILQELYAQAHVAVFPGKGQGSWLGPFEQLTLGTPVIVSPNLSCSDLIKAENLGIVTEDFVGALEDVYNNYSKYSLQASKAREYVTRELTWDKFTRRMLELMS